MAGGFLNPRIATGLVAMRPTGGINFDRRTPSRCFPISSDAPCSVRLTMFAHAHAHSSKPALSAYYWTPSSSTATPASSPTTASSSFGKKLNKPDLEIQFLRRFRRRSTPPAQRFSLLTCIIKAGCCPCSSHDPHSPPRVQPPEDQPIKSDCATPESNSASGFGYVPALGLLRGVVCLSHSHSHREPPHSPGPPSGLTRCQTVPLFWGI